MMSGFSTRPKRPGNPGKTISISLKTCMLIVPNRSKHCEESSDDAQETSGAGGESRFGRRRGGG